MEERKNVIIFKGKEHKEFYLKNLKRCRYQDVYHRALIYSLGIDRDTREHIDEIYDFHSGYIKTECLYSGWQTSGSKKITRMAFNLYNDGTPSVYDYKDREEQMDECRKYSVGDLFCCSYAVFFWQAIKLRYPEYCEAA